MGSEFLVSDLEQRAQKQMVKQLQSCLAALFPAAATSMGKVTQRICEGKRLQKNS